VFYRGAWCPYCNIALATYQAQLLPQLTERGITLVAVSPQAPDGSLSMAEKNDLAYPVVSDPGSTVAGQLGILTAPSAEARASQLQLGLDLTAVNADATTTLPMPTAVILDAEHVLRWIDAHPPLQHPHRSPPDPRRPRPARPLGTPHEAHPDAPQEGRPMTVRLGLLALLEAKPGKGDDLAAFLQAGRALAMAEVGTVTWYAFKISDTSYGIFDTFETDEARDAHLGGQIPQALGQVAPDLLASDPDIRTIDIIAVK